MSCKVGDKHSPLRQTSDLSFSLVDCAIANKVNVIYVWLHTDEMNFMPKFLVPSDVQPSGKTVKQQELQFTPSKTTCDKTNVAFSPEFQKSIVDISRGHTLKSVSSVEAQENFNTDTLRADVQQMQQALMEPANQQQ